MEKLEEYWKSKAWREAVGIPVEADLTFKKLAQGEYNVNYAFTDPATGRKMLFRVNTGSQMHLPNQIEYEYHALNLLKESGRTPMPIFVDGSKKQLDFGVMVMEFLEGHPLDYHKDMRLAAECLADIHSVQLDGGCGLLQPENPLKAILEECEQMIQTYYESPLGEEAKKTQIREMLAQGKKMAEKVADYQGYRCCINTELNSGNFLINGDGRPNYLIDWEKPLFGDPAQDLGHFLAPTTTFWKTDVVLKETEMDAFAVYYRECVNGRFDLEGLEERMRLFIPITCLRGITWCAMAWVQYQSADKLIRNEDTFRKLEQYLDQHFLDDICARYFAIE